MCSQICVHVWYLLYVQIDVQYIYLYKHTFHIYCVIAYLCGKFGNTECLINFQINLGEFK